MPTTRRLYAVAAGALLIGAANSGCSMSQRQVSVACKGQLDDDRMFTVAHLVSTDAACSRSKHNYAELSVAVTKHGVPVLQEVVARREGLSPDDQSPLELGPIEARIDAARDRIWLVDRSGQRVIASVDLEAKRITGTDVQHPEWAKPDLGTLFFLLPRLNSRPE